MFSLLWALSEGNSETDRIDAVFQVADTSPNIFKMFHVQTVQWQVFWFLFACLLPNFCNAQHKHINFETSSNIIVAPIYHQCSVALRFIHVPAMNDLDETTLSHSYDSAHETKCVL